MAHIDLLNPHSGATEDNNNNIRKTKAIAAIPMGGITVVTAALVSGLVVVSFMGNSYQPAIAQTGNATTTEGLGQFPCAPVQAGGEGGGGGGGQNTSTTTTATTTMGGAATTADTNTTTTTTTGDEGNQAIGELAIHIQEACLAAHDNDIPGVLMHLNLALDALNAVRAGDAINATAALEEEGLMLDPAGPELIEVEPEGGAEGGG